jgi:hypothetical protein
MIGGHWYRALLVGVFAMGCGSALAADEKTEQAKPAESKPARRGREYLDREHAPKRGEGWIDLFNRKDLSGWKKRDPNQEMSWKVVDRILTNESPHEKPGVDIISEQTFDDYEIYYEYKLPKDSNSGVYFRGRYEVQVLEDHGKPATVESNGGIYSLTAPSKNVSKPAGEWQVVYANIKGRKVNVWLNGEHVVQDFEVKHPTGLALDNEEDKPGPVLVQGNHGSIEFRYIMVRPIKK